ncbi:MAG: hypothetical protein WCS03_06410 [Bacteroidota bacterium]
MDSSSFEGIANKREEGKLDLVAPVYGQDASVTEWSVGAKEFGNFMITIFDEWVRNDVARYYVQIIDTTKPLYGIYG